MTNNERAAFETIVPMLRAAGLSFTTRQNKHLLIVVDAGEKGRHSIALVGRHVDEARNFARQKARRLFRQLGIAT